MNRKNLTDAFGEIDDKLFAVTETESVNELSPKGSDNVQAPIFIKNVSKSKNRKRRRAVISAAAGIAACAALAVSLPVLFNNTAPPYGSAETTESLTQQPAAAETDGQTEQTQAETQPVTPETQPVTAETPQEPTQIELYTKIKEILNAEEVYKVEKTQIDLSGFEANGRHDNGALWSIYSYTSQKDTMLIEGSSFFYTLVGSAVFPNEHVYDPEERYGHIFLFDMDTGEHSLILKERAYKENNGLLLKPMNYVDGWLYYYRMEIYPTEGSYESDGTELWRINTDTQVKEKITDLYEPYYKYKKAGVRSGKYLYFIDSPFTVKEPYEKDPRILRYDTEEGQLDIFKEAVVNDGGGFYSYPCVFKYKNGIIYSTDGIKFYYHTDDGVPDKALPALSRYNQDRYFLETIGNSGLLYGKDIDSDNQYPYPYLIGILDDEFNGRDLAAFPDLTILDTNTGSDLKAILMAPPTPQSEQILIYDSEMDCFSELKLPSEDIAVYFTGQGDELRILVYSGDGNRCEGLTLYSIKK